MLQGMDDILSAASKDSKDQLRGYEFEQKEVELIGDESLIAKEVGWKSSSGCKYLSKPVSDWGVRDILSYCYAKYRELTGEVWPISYRGGQEGILKVQESLKDFFGEWPSSKLTKLYIDYFFSEKAEAMIASYSSITFKMLRYDQNLSNFMTTINELNIGVETKNKKKNIDDNISEKEVDMNGLRQNDVFKFIDQYGIFVSYIWFRKKDSMSEDESIKEIKKHTNRIIDLSGIDVMYDKAEKMGPYHVNMKREFKNLLTELSKSTGKSFMLISAEHTNEPKRFQFLSQ